MDNIDTANKESKSAEGTRREPSLIDFSSEYSDNFPLILNALNINLFATSYDSRRLLLIRGQGEELNLHLEFFSRPMGLFVDENNFTLGTLSQVLNFKRTDFFLDHIKAGEYDDIKNLSRKLQERDPEKIEEFIRLRNEKLNELKQSDSLYVERAALNTGRINIHDIAWGDDRLWILNTAFSCIASLDPEYNFVAHWRPDFISDLAPEDRCHLNGMAMVNGRPKYVTVCGQKNIKDHWYYEELNGAVIDIDSNEKLVQGLSMPHSPRVHKNKIYVCDSGYACIRRIDPTSGNIELFKQLPGFCRGMCFYGDILFVGLSCMRDSDTIMTLPLRNFLKPEDTYAGILMLNADTGETLASLKFTGDLGQIYDVAVVPGTNFASIIGSFDIFNQHLFDFVEA